MTAIRSGSGKRTANAEVKTKNRKQGPRDSILIIVLVVIAIFLTSFFLPLFNIRYIKVTGNAILTTENIIGVSGIQNGVNIFRVNLQSCKDRIEAMPYVDSLQVKRNFPNKIQIDIVERKPIGKILFMGSYIVIDKEGNVLEVMESMDKISIPLIGGMRFSRFSIGEKLEVDNKDKLDIIFLCVKEILRNDLISSISRIDVEDNYKVKFMINNKVIIDIGDKSELNYKVCFLKEILNEIDVEQPGYVDLSSGKPIFKPISNE